MLGNLIRVLLALTAVAPLAVSLSYIYAAKEHNYKLAAIAAFACIVLGLLSLRIIDFARSKLEQLPITIQKAKSADKEVLGFFVAYALPLIFKGPAAPDLETWLVAGGMLLFVLFSTHAMQVNPVLGMFGFHFYEVETRDGITYLLISRRKINNVKTVTHVVQLSEYGILEASTTAKGTK
jgi:hypothetical protein